MDFRYNLEQVFDDFIKSFVIHGSLIMFVCGILIVFSGAYRSSESLIFSENVIHMCNEYLGVFKPF